MTLSRTFLRYLEQAGYRFDVIQHRKTYTAWDTSQTERVKPQEVAKSLAVKIDREVVVAMVPAHRMLDLPKLAACIVAERRRQLKTEKDPKIRKMLGKSLGKPALAPEAWLKKNLPGKVGAVAPFRGVIGRDVFLDRALARLPKIYCGTGEYEYSVRIATRQFIGKEKPVVGVFSRAKK